MIQEQALKKITASLQTDPLVQAVFVKGSIGRGEHDENSDIDLYCLVEESDKQSFLERRLHHLQSYGSLLFYDDIFIIAPQIIAVYEDLLHVDLFTVTEETYIEKDYFRVIYDPERLMDKYVSGQHLTLSQEEFLDDVTDVAWFLLQYRKTALRGNNLWAVGILHHIAVHLARVLLHCYSPNRAQLGLKAVEASLPVEMEAEVRTIFQSMTPELHSQAAVHVVRLLQKHRQWLLSQLASEPYTKRLLATMIAAETWEYQSTKL
ncbi:nucleotidyltransferase domain-containing protein [Sediminibacillus halophilus]|uniref:Nucleotidyltransferase domain-containing protein n=1 Tax=Sediminibacillus halophilus TaxID=482461 RepID=A0A1G9P1R6_9BACI|nr:nucleotidyltransferase domain-containing protein [Sediminibacillus halophilus]SDL92513.1 Nucleotidyltransferase domain-containing protein [Sediminibacillus halophilus]